ncbi:hypothetical protein C7974DRAFT_417541 [Boeremia exigua]|uniref:uncharacterized protein n=1 Tax=Boeremia exigua TaxID=749465 RepID=UPI001E8D72B9|nr:uncharacterized protein C7974DRAFT_417541 [Boeremia exigua]KAH6615363.1 hypothetical protein C7974DRAFT_417541 [Boeremia exigua]
MATQAAVPLPDYTFQSSDEAEMMSLTSPEWILTPLESDTVEPPFVPINMNLQYANEAESVTLAPTPPPEQHPMLDRVDSIKSVPPRSTIKLVFSVWLVEITCTFISLGVLTAVASILGVNNGRPNPEWSGGITLNTIVSFGSMFFRISLMVPVASCISQLTWIWFAQARRPLLDVVRFDHASRSISGSLSLIYTHHFMTVAFIGAIITVAGLGIGPFLQQTLVFYSSSVLDTSVTSYTSSEVHITFIVAKGEQEDLGYFSLSKQLDVENRSRGQYRPSFHMAAELRPSYLFTASIGINWTRANDLSFNHGFSYISPNSTLESKQCEIYNCIHVIKAEVKNGVYSESIVEEIIVPAASEDNDYNQTWAYTQSNGTTVNLTIETIRQVGIIAELLHPFPNSMIVTANGETIYGNVTAVNREVLWGPRILQQIYMASNVTETIVSVVQNVNIALRTFRTLQARISDSNLPPDFISERHRVAGSVWRDTIHVRVRWIWLALPASLLVLTIILLIATICLSRAEKVGIWKDSSLALLLFSRWNDQEKPSMGVAQTQEDIREAVKGMRAQLAKDVDVHGSDLKGTMLIERIPKSRK